jgi:hypothetical protein
MILTLVLLALLQAQGPGEPPTGWSPSSKITPLEASGPSQVVKIPVAEWDSDATSVAPDVSFSYAVTGSDADTYLRIVDGTKTPPTVELKLFPQGVNLTAVDIGYAVYGGTSGYVAGVHTWTFAGFGVVIPKKHPVGWNPETIEAKIYTNRYRAEDVVTDGPMHDEPYTISVQLSRAAFTIWKPAATGGGTGPGTPPPTGGGT